MGIPRKQNPYLFLALGSVIGAIGVIGATSRDTSSFRHREKNWVSILAYFLDIEKDTVPRKASQGYLAYKKMHPPRTLP